MDAPTEWTYGGLLDWSSADSLKLAPVGMATRCIIEALKERAEAANYTLPAILSAEWEPLRIGYPVVSAIQDSVTALIIKFCNHTDSGGDWTGLADAADVAPQWTEPDVLAVLEAPARLELKRLNPFSSEWFFQQYQILNLLRWKKIQESHLLYETRLTAVGYFVKSVGYWDNQAQSEFLAAPWNGPYVGLWEGWGAYYGVGGVYPVEDGRNPSETIIRSKRRYQHNQIDTVGCVYDIYAFTVPGSVGWSMATFNSQGANVIENAFAKIYSSPELTADTEFDVLDDDSVPPNRPPWSYPGDYSSKFWGWQITKSSYVLKFDGANGFKFRDWE